MTESLLGRWFYVCNCGPSCDCGYRADVPSNCPCGEAATRRRVLVEDEHNFYVSPTGKDARGSNNLGDKGFEDADGNPLQGFRKAWNLTKRKFMYRGKQIELNEDDDACTVTLETREFKAMRHVERGMEGWMGYPCYRMFESAEFFARALVDDWDIIGDEKRLAPPPPGHDMHGQDHDQGHDH